MKAVLDILQELGLAHIPQVLIFNKCDRLPAQQAEALCRRYQAMGISALNPATVKPLIEHLATRVHAMMSGQDIAHPPSDYPEPALASPV